MKSIRPVVIRACHAHFVTLNLLQFPQRTLHLQSTLPIPYRDYHFAMDGKLAGILERHDGLCHLNGTYGEPGYYTHSEILDYPSISQISSVVQQNSFLTIFAVIPRYKSIWEAMSRLVPGSSVEILEEDSENIVELITKSYGEITSTIKVTVDNVPEDVIVTISSR